MKAVVYDFSDRSLMVPFPSGLFGAWRTNTCLLEVTCNVSPLVEHRTRCSNSIPPKSKRRLGLIQRLVELTSVWQISPSFPESWQCGRYF